MRIVREALREHILLIQAVILAVCSYIEDSLYIPSGLRTMDKDALSDQDALRGVQLTESLLTGNPQRIQNLTRLKRETFKALLQWLIEHTGLKDSREVSAAEKLIIFLLISSHGANFRMASKTLQRSTRTIHRAFNEVLNCLLHLHKDFVVLPSDTTGDEIERDDKRWPYFADCIGALGGTLIEVWISHKEQAPWKSRKGSISQNVLAVCDFKMNFLYVLAGWEGSASDGRVLADAKLKGFQAPAGRYYVADAGYSNSNPTLVPYPKVRHEQAQAMQKPQNSKELFNLRHSSLRNVIERTFGVLQQRFTILQKAPRQYSIKTQVKLIYALTALHNFMNKHGYNPETEALLTGDPDVPDEPTWDEPEAGDPEMALRRDEIAEQMWRDYQDYRRRFVDIDV
jgi:hypothetical protein